MSIQVKWDDDTRRVMRYTLDNDWTWEEFYAAKKQANALMDAVPHKLGVIVDASHVRPFPPDLLSNTRNSIRTRHPNTVVVVFLVTHPLLRTVMNSLRHVAHFTALRIEIAATLDEARAIACQRLREQDAASSNP